MQQIFGLYGRRNSEEYTRQHTVDSLILILPVHVRENSKDTSDLMDFWKTPYRINYTIDAFPSFHFVINCSQKLMRNFMRISS
jgi:hypothetical protein